MNTPVDIFVKNKIFKYQIPLDRYGFPFSVFSITMHPGVILKIDTQNKLPFFWAEVNPHEEMIEMKFQVIGTGHKVPTNHSYWGSWKSNPEGSFIWHLYSKIQGEIY